MRTKRLQVFTAFLGLILALGRAENAWTQEVSEYTVKAAYLFNFTKFTEWPDKAFAGADSPLVIGILGDDPFGSELDKAVEGKTVNGRGLKVKRFNGYDGSQAAALRKCHVLFIAYSEKDRLRDVLQALSGAPVLTVSEIEQFPVKDGMILFDQEGQKIVLQINPTAAEKAGLKISSKLLMVSKVYKPE